MNEEYLSMETVEKLAKLNELEKIFNDLKEYIEYALNNPFVDEREALKIILNKMEVYIKNRVDFNKKYST